MNTNFHIGPYLGVKRVKIKVKKQEVITSCGNKKCENYKRDLRNNFCHVCGTKVEKIEITVTDDLDAWNLLMNTNRDRLTTAGSGADKNYTFISNKKAPFMKKRQQHLNNGAMFIVHTSDFNELDEIKWFEKEYKKEIDYLKEYLGDNNVFVDWGIFSWR